MEKLNELLIELGISKVRLAKYLGVSRQMLYNYLDSEDLSGWPKEKALKVLNLFDITTAEELNNLNIDSDFIADVNTKLNESATDSKSKEILADLKNFNKKEQEMLTDIINFLKEKLAEDKTKETYNTYRYLFHFLQSMETNPELRYILGYMSKSMGFVEHNEYAFNENQQFVFESILFSAMTLYSSGGASRTKIAETHKRFVQEIEHKKEERLSRTQELNTAKVQALKELGYTDINNDNAKEVLDKIAEIQSRKV